MDYCDTVTLRNLIRLVQVTVKVFSLIFRIYNLFKLNWSRQTICIKVKVHVTQLMQCFHFFKAYDWMNLLLGTDLVYNWLSHLALMRYSARLMLAGEPVMVTWRSVDPSTGLAILIWAPDICLISLILAPWRPMIHPISCSGEELSDRNA